MPETTLELNKDGSTCCGNCGNEIILDADHDISIFELDPPEIILYYKCVCGDGYFVICSVHEFEPDNT